MVLAHSHQGISNAFGYCPVLDCPFANGCLTGQRDEASVWVSLLQLQTVEVGGGFLNMKAVLLLFYFFFRRRLVEGGV